MTGEAKDEDAWMKETGIMKGVPIPEPKGRGKKRKYPFDTMAIGDCIDGEDGIQRAAASWQYTQKGKTNAEFTARKINNNLYRVWRVK